jgi:hypothetical protein
LQIANFTAIGKLTAKTLPTPDNIPKRNIKKYVYIFFLSVALHTYKSPTSLAWNVIRQILFMPKRDFRTSMGTLNTPHF